MTDYIFGANILENLTTGMYQDSKVIYREYIQNSCDQIDKAVKYGILKPDEGAIKIWLDRDQRTITIEDNATGISFTSFEQTLKNIADSDKKIGEDKGFRGIGRLCGLAYCKELIYESCAIGEDTISIMVCDAKKMRGLIEENERGKKHTANEVLHAINSFEQKKTDDLNSHFFRVKLVGINQENTDLLDFQQVKDYLSFVAPVPYQSAFYYRSEVYKHAKELNVKIDEYNVMLNGETIFKKYITILKESVGTKYDDIFGINFNDFYDVNGELFAWMWVGLSKFQKAIPKINQMRGLRLRKENIQIGGEDSLQKLFKEDRGNSYFIGEVFAISKNLIPNSQRDYFNENIARAEFEKGLRKYFNEELHKVYYDGSALNSAYKKIDAYEKKEAEFKEKEATSSFVDKEHRETDFKIVLETKKEAQNAQVRIEKLKNKAEADNLMQKVIERIEYERPKLAIKEINASDNTDSPKEGKLLHRTDRLTQYSRSERKLISKIFSIILKETDSEAAERIINLLYNFEDNPDDLYYRMRMNIDLCDELGVTIYSFPMKYHPIADPNYFYNREYIGKYWNRKFIRSVQAVLNATKGKIGRGKSFFEEAFGKDIDEFHKILWMPEAFIIYRFKYKDNLAVEWWKKYNNLDDVQLNKLKKIVEANIFDETTNTGDIAVDEVLEYYQVKRDHK